MADTNPSGSEPLDVNSAASAFLGLMGDDEGADSQPELEQDSEQEDVAETDDDDEASYEVDSEDEVEEAVDAEPETKRFKVKAAGEEIEVELDELISGYQRSKDYTQKSQALAEQRKALETEQAQVAEVQAEREAYSQRLQALDSFLASQMPSNENLAELKEIDPIGYAVKIAERSELEKQSQAVKVEQDRLAQKQQAENDARLQKHLQNESQLLLAALPEMAGEKGDALKKEVLSYAKDSGYTNQQLSQLYDHKAVVHLYKSMKYDQLQGSKPEALKKVQAAPKTMKAGTTPAPSNSQQKQKAMQKLRQTGRVADAAAAFERFL